MTSKMVAGQLGATGLCVCPDFLSAKSLCTVAGDLDRIREAGEFRRAEVGRGAVSRDQARVRTDSTYWLNRDLQNSVQTMLWRKIDLLRTAFNRTLFLGLTDFEGHYAAYPKGGYYQRHKDCFSGDSGRVVSFVLYLNRDWQPPDGGCLRVYGTDGNGVESHNDIDPKGGTMVCFMSSESEHEVLPSHEQRFSLAGWFHRKP